MHSIEFAIVVRIELGLDEQVVLNPFAFETLDDLGNTIDKDRFGLLRGTAVLSQSVWAKCQARKGQTENCKARNEASGCDGMDTLNHFLHWVAWIGLRQVGSNRSKRLHICCGL